MMDVGRSARIYEIVALAPEGTAPTRDEFRIMLQSLLATRFKLATHTEKRDTAVYVLQTDGKPQFKVSAGDGPCRPAYSFAPGGQRIVATHCPVFETLRKVLFVDRPIYDQTGLTGFYDFEITAAAPYRANDPSAITAFDAVKELGLKLDAQRLPVDTIVIDHVEAPTEN
jgi:uncharacterized protein (TIGR03435 family)